MFIIINTLLLLLFPSAPLPKLKKIEKINISFMFLDISKIRLKKQLKMMKDETYLLQSLPKRCFLW